MPDLAALANDIKGLPDQALQSELTHPTGLVPSYLVLAEAQRRQLMRQAAQKQQGQQSGSVYQDVIRNMMARQPPPGPPAPAGMTPSSSAPPQPGATPPQNFSPPKTMAEGGSVDDEDSGDSGDSGDGEQPNDLVQKLGQAIYRMEGSQPNSLATRNNNPGNLRSAGDQSGSSGGYAVFPDMDTGWEALHRQIQKNIDRGLTLKEFFAGKPGVYDGYAPAADKNQPLQYAANVADWTGIDPDAPLSSQITGRKSAPPASADTTPLASNPFMGPLTPPTGLAAANQAVQQPASDQDTSVSQPAPTTAAPSRPVRRPIDDEIARLDAQIGQQQDQLNKPSRNNVQDLQENIRAILPALGYSPDALQNMEQRAYSSKATIQALQADALNRYHKRDPWTYLSNLAAGMADSKSVLLPQMLAHGAAYAANAQDEAREKALSDWDALNKESQTIDNNVASLHERLSTAVGGLLERQTNANAVDQQRRLAEIERLQKNRQDLLLKKPLVEPADQPTIDYYVKQVGKDAANWSLVPTEWKTHVGQALAAAGTDVQRLDAATRAAQAPQDPQEVKYWSDQVQGDVKNWSMVAPNKGLAEAVRKELGVRGVNVAQLDAMTRQTAIFAQTVQPHVQTINDEINKLDKPGVDKLGPVFGRWNEFKTGKYGAGDPAYTELRNNINLLDSAVARIHGGARGGSSPPMIEYMHSMLSAGPKDAATMRAGMNVFSDWINGYARMAPKPGAPSGSSSGASAGIPPGTESGTPPRPSAIPFDAADAQYSPRLKQWRYKPKGSDQWVAVPSQ